MKHDKPLYSITDLARHLGVPTKTVWHHVRISQSVPEPTITRGRRTFYAPRDVEQIVSAFHGAGERLAYVKDYISEQ